MRRKRRGRALRRVLVAGAALFVLAGLLVAVAAFNLSPAQLKQRVTSALRGALAPECEFSLGRVCYRWGEGLVIEDFRLSAPPGFGSSNVLIVEKLKVVPRLGSLLGGAAAFSLVELDGCDVLLERGPEKDWNLAGVLRSAAGPDAGAPGAVPDRVRFRNAMVRIARASLAELLELETEALPEEWCRLRVEGEIEVRRDRFAISAAVRHALLPVLQVEGARARDKRRGALDIAAYKVPINADLLRLLPAPLRRAAAPYEPAGSADLRLRVAFAPDARPALHLEGRVFGGQASLPGLPYQVRHIKGLVAFDGETLSFPAGIEGAIADGSLAVSGSIPLRDGASGRLTVGVDRIALDERLAGELPEDLRGLWKRLNLRGQAGGEAELRWSNGVLDPRVVIRLGGMSVAYDELPYAVGDIRGTLIYEGGRLRTESPLNGARGATAVTVSIDADAEERGRIDVLVQAKGVRLDQYLRSCLSPATREAWDQFRLEGTADAEIAVVRAPGEEHARFTVTLTGTDARMCYVHFPYTIEGITGKLIINHDDVEVLDLAGVHGATRIRCRKGFWRAKDGQAQYAFIFESPDMPVDRDLARALPEEQRRVLEEFAFQGNVAVKATVLQLPEHAQMHLEIEADLLRGRMEYARFPYPLRLRGGHLSIGTSIIRLENIATDEPELQACLERGTIEDVDGERRYDFRLAVKNLRPEPAFIRALPPHVGRLLSELSVDGLFDAARITVGYAHKKKDPDDFTLRYFVEDLTAEDAGMNLGMRFRHMRGRASILGSAAAGVPHTATGRIELERLRFNRLWLNDVVLKCTYGATHELIRALAAPGTVVPDGPPLEDAERRAFIARLAGEAQAQDCFQVWIAQAAAYEGTIKGFLAADVGARKDLIGAVDVQGLNLGLASQDIFRTGEAAGTAAVHAFFQGMLPDVATFTGQGRGQIREANLVKLPLFISMFRDVLSVQRIKDTYFHLVDARFGIGKGKFTALSGDAIAMESDVMTLRGFGSVDFDLNCDLFLSLPSFGLPQIPLISPFLRRIIDNIAAFHVTGPLDEPQISYVLMRDLQMLFRSEPK
ncbi:MAG TPA: hypothetical protein PKX48_13185 [Planctomycetota bacterium]|jgi:hypothetical protein|nr:hypothetical protein [Planctomycetota bacterium]OQC19356.1 MAG: hypothetical protein BWX69_02780 [Planctomycetes bacterium ADurb.Bin069]HNR99982.1 hypothetical protein [Planctomycetota bacterium]HNU25690.1 hypothetical protein [Planctomycetota bacterium]HOE31078.1 hypothetical protein [Planctomycetota bacterium]